jgi:hypothetical protein
VLAIRRQRLRTCSYNFCPYSSTKLGRKFVHRDLRGNRSSRILAPDWHQLMEANPPLSYKARFHAVRAASKIQLFSLAHSWRRKT